MKSSKLNKPEDIYFFLEDQVKNGFYIPATMKQCFAAEIQVMEDLKAICDRHGLRFFADWGSLLGAARHGGFIPWDDDLDLLMLREDYTRLLDLYENHPEEFPEGMEVRSFRNRDNYSEFHGVVVGSSNISFDIKHLEKFHGFPYIAAIDIFVLDYKADQIEDQKQMAKNALFTIAVADEIYSGVLNDKASIKANLDKIASSGYARNLPTDLDMSKSDFRKALYQVAEDMFASFGGEGRKKLIQNIPWGLKYPDQEIESWYYSKQAYLPFEYTEIPVPLAYDTMLSSKYGNYLKVVKNVAGHNYPCFAGQEINLKKVMNIKLPEFEYDPDMESKIAKARQDNYENSWKATLKECLGLMKEKAESIFGNLQEVEGANDSNPDLIEDTLQLLADLQQLTMDLGGFLETVTEKSKPTVAEMEKLCQAVYELYTAITSGNPIDSFRDALSISFDQMMKEAKLLEKLELIVIFPFKAQGFERVEKIYKDCLDKENTEVKVIPIPYYHKKFDGSFVNQIYSKEGYPEGLELWNYKDFDLALYYPDLIITQFPYNQWNKVMDIDSTYYSTNLACFCKTLIYVPWFETGDFSKEDFCDYENTKYYVSMPGVMYSDKVFVNSSKIRDVYLERLVEFAGKAFEDKWKEKIEIMKESSSEEAREANAKEANQEKETKKLLCFIGLSSFLQYEDELFEKLDRVIESFNAASASLEVGILFDKAVELNLPKLNNNLWKKYKDYRNKLEKTFIVIDSNSKPELLAKAYDAYYGDRSYFATLFVEKHKPVMIMNVSV